MSGLLAISKSNLIERLKDRAIMGGDKDLALHILFIEDDKEQDREMTASLWLDALAMTTRILSDNTVGWQAEEKASHATAGLAAARFANVCALLVRDIASYIQLVVTP